MADFGELPFVSAAVQVLPVLGVLVVADSFIQRDAAHPVHRTVYDQDRLVRQPKELEELLEACDCAHAWHIAAVSGEVDVRNSDDLFRARILAAVNAKESDNISRRVRRKQRELAEQGRPHGGPRRYGYRRDFSAIEPAEAAIVQELARRVLAAESLSSLCLDLNARGVPTAAAGRWTPATLRRV